MMTKSEKSNICMRALIKAGYKKIGKNVIEIDDTVCEVRAHKFRTTKKGDAAIIDYFVESSQDSCENIVMISYERGYDNAYIIRKSSFVNMINTFYNKHDFSHCWMCDTEGDDSNMSKSTCQAVLISSLLSLEGTKVISL